jgi:hypothetical protein
LQPRVALVARMDGRRSQAPNALSSLRLML